MYVTSPKKQRVKCVSRSAKLNTVLRHIWKLDCGISRPSKPVSPLVKNKVTRKKHSQEKKLHEASTDFRSAQAAVRAKLCTLNAKQKNGPNTVGSLLAYTRLFMVPLLSLATKALEQIPYKERQQGLTIPYLLTLASLTSSSVLCLLLK